MSLEACKQFDVTTGSKLSLAMFMFRQQALGVNEVAEDQAYIK